MSVHRSVPAQLQFNMVCVARTGFCVQAPWHVLLLQPCSHRARMRPGHNFFSYPILGGTCVQRGGGGGLVHVYFAHWMGFV
jgi:hypothetical protein